MRVSTILQMLPRRRLYHFLPVVLLGAVTVVVQPQVISALEQANVHRAARQSTVLVDGQNPGSGVIIGKQGNVYYVLTAEHVVSTEDEYEIVTADGSRHTLSYSTVKKLPNNVDLAVVFFTSSQNYPVAKLGNSSTVTEGDRVFVAGWPAPGKALPHIYQITSGEISGLCPRPIARGYRLVYTNVTRAGMSGGPVFNEGGQVIGIHGMAEGREVYQAGYDAYPVKTGFNLGIPINTFSRLAKRVDVNLAQLPNAPKTPSAPQQIATQPTVSDEPKASPAVPQIATQLPTTPKIPPAPQQVATQPVQLPESSKAPPAPQQVAVQPTQLPTTPKTPPAPQQVATQPVQLPESSKAPPAPQQVAVQPAPLPTAPPTPPAPQQVTQPAQLPTPSKAPPSPQQVVAQPARLPDTPTIPLPPQQTGITLAEVVDVPKLPPPVRGEKLTFAQAPRLINTQATSKNARELGATYYFTINLPPAGTTSLQQVNFTLKQGVEYPRFKAKAVHAFEGTSKRKGSPLPIGLIVTDPPTRTLSVVFDPPLPPGKDVTIAVRPVRNPTVGTYQFETRAFPKGEAAQGQFIGLGRLEFYRSSSS